jgi:hypothetical protein
MFPGRASPQTERVKTAPPVLCSALQLPDAGGVPEWLHLLPAGEVRTADGRGPYSVRDAAQLMAASLPAGGKLVLDENHATDLAAPKGGSAPARGWIVELQQRVDGMWGKVDWTPEGRRLAEHREYRGVSPVILHDAAGAITRVLRASLTNTPNLAGLATLHSQETTMDFRAWLIEALGLAADAADDAIATAMQKALGLPADATPAAVAAAMKKKLAEKPDAAAGVALQSALAPIAAIVGVTGEATPAAVLAGVQQLKKGGAESPAVVALQSELATVTGQLNALTDAGKRSAAVTFVDGAIALGRVGVKPMRDDYIAMHMEDPTRAERLVNAMPAVKGGASLTGVPADTDKDGLGTADTQVIQLMGLDPTKYAETLGAQKQEAL